MNQKQRNSNRANAAWLKHQQLCPECGLPGLHYMQLPTTLEEIMTGSGIHSGFWTCDKFYGADGRRLEIA
jgi:hypothetical protein